MHDLLLQLRDCRDGSLSLESGLCAFCTLLLYVFGMKGHFFTFPYHLQLYIKLQRSSVTYLTGWDESCSVDRCFSNDVTVRLLDHPDCERKHRCRRA